MFIDSATIYVAAGNGGNGMVSFHTAIYVPNGGPDGGDGGRGGDVVFIADENIRTLQDFRYKRKYKAMDGENGGRRKCTGAAGKSLEIALPVGTVIKDADTGDIIADLCIAGQKFVAAKGGHGGKGNIHFTNSVRQAPNFARAGEVGEERNLQIEIKLLADIGLIGFPNVGKSTLLSVISSAKPKIADYHFTTLEPNLGVVKFYDEHFVVADIPGLIEGAAEGAGLGHEFLKHIERTKMFVHVIDVSGNEGRNPDEDFYAIMKELESYLPGLSKRPQIIAANKSDIASEENISTLQKVADENNIKMFLICAPINEGVDALVKEMCIMAKSLPPTMLMTPETSQKRYTLDDEQLFTIDIVDDTFYVKGTWINNLVDSTNFDDTESLQYFQRLLRKKGVIEALEQAGIEDDDLVVMHTLEFEFVS